MRRQNTIELLLDILGHLSISSLLVANYNRAENLQSLVNFNHERWSYMFKEISIYLCLSKATDFYLIVFLNSFHSECSQQTPLSITFHFCLDTQNISHSTPPLSLPLITPTGLAVSRKPSHHSVGIRYTF